MDIGTASRPRRGETECGDQVAVIADPDGTTLIALADGLGHGPKAAEAARAAMEFITQNPALPLEDLVRDCGRSISHTRGAALSVMRIDELQNRIEYAGVGNVELQARIGKGARPVNNPGIVGRQLRRVNTFFLDLTAGDLFLLHSDGISSRLDLGRYLETPCPAMARDVLEKFGKDHDDACCVAVRY